jgi:hypothetical protein
MKLRLAGLVFTLALAGCADTAPPVQVTPMLGAAPAAHPDVVHRPGYATYLSGEDLWEACGKTADGVASVACRTYVVGVSDGHNSSMAHKGLNTTYCLHYGTMADDLATVVRNYLKSHPDRLSRPAASLVMTALENGYPCRHPD